jgi:hypothetical protein
MQYQSLRGELTGVTIVTALDTTAHAQKGLTVLQFLLLDRSNNPE